MALPDKAFLATMLITNGRCYYCGVRIWPIVWIDRNHSIDHVIPRCRGGSDDRSNLVPACRTCNSIKNGLSLEEARHAFAVRATRMPPFSREQIAWMRAKGCDLKPYDGFKFWFETHKTRHTWLWSDSELTNAINNSRRRLAAL